MIFLSEVCGTSLGGAVVDLSQACLTCLCLQVADLRLSLCKA